MSVADLVFGCLRRVRRMSGTRDMLSSDDLGGESDYLDERGNPSRRYHPLLLLLRYACVALLALLGLLLLSAGNRSVYLDKSSDAIAAEQAFWVVLGLSLLGTAIVLGWLNGSASRWLKWAALAAALAPVMTFMTFSTERPDTFHCSTDALYDGLTFIVLALVFSAICYPASRLGRRRLRWGSAWLMGCCGLLLGAVAVGLVWNAAQPQPRRHADRERRLPGAGRRLVARRLAARERHTRGAAGVASRLPHPHRCSSRRAVVQSAPRTYNPAHPAVRPFGPVQGRAPCSSACS
jgi:hypothetical protein